MAKGKHKPTLYEVMRSPDRRGSDSPLAPTWWQKRKIAARKEWEDSRTTAAAPDASEQETIEIPQTDDIAQTQEWKSWPGESGWLSVSNRTIHMSMRLRWAAIGLLATVLVILSAFELGRYYGYHAGYAHGGAAETAVSLAGEKAEPVDEVQLAMRQPVNTSLLQSLESPPPKPAAEVSPNDRKPAETPAKAGWVSGLNYVLVQSFAKDRLEDARLAARFLARNGIAADIVEKKESRLPVWLMTRRGFDYNDPSQKQEADRFLDTIHRLGKEYYEGGGQYKLQGYFVKLSGERW